MSHVTFCREKGRMLMTCRAFLSIKVNESNATESRLSSAGDEFSDSNEDEFSDSSDEDEFSDSNKDEEISDKRESLLLCRSRSFYFSNHKHMLEAEMDVGNEIGRKANLKPSRNLTNFDEFSDFSDELEDETLLESPNFNFARDYFPNAILPHWPSVQFGIDFEEPNPY
ncbi:unnamed protein product [Litomosoides sigmodontis]|uniref:Uncharacterized protein n=1 Tax=Litomosoides sigmodontis TaxID=42156 RepID=A0A3P6TE76_LITSI|nr:unnamed protein product [Litomosoides sigmodontis]